MDFEKLGQLAIEAALNAGKIIEKYLNEEVTVERKAGGNSQASQVVTVVDRACEAAILAHLAPSCSEYDLALLSEERPDDGSRLVKDFFWCIDPMDGTLAFINKRPGFSVSIALVSRDGTPCIGVVYDPSTATLYHAIKEKGAFKNQVPWELPSPQVYFTLVGDKALKETTHAERIEMLICAKQKELGLVKRREITGAGAVLNAIYVAENGPACYMKIPKKEEGGGSIWDFAATACIYQELGLTATSFSGGKLDLNREESCFMNHEGVYFANW